MTTIGVSRPTPSGVRGVLLVIEHFWLWYRRNWRSSVVSTVLQPVLMLLAFGLAFGSLVRPSPATGNVPYLVYLAPGLLAMTAVQIAASESTYPVFSGFKWQRTYFAMSAGPLSAGQVVAGQLSWIGLRMLSSGAVYIVVIALFGGVRGMGVAAALVFATLCGLAMAAPIVAFAATINNEGSSFSSLFRFVILPMTLFAGTFFPVSQLPAWVQPLAWISPLWHGTELARGAALDTWRLLPTVGHVGYLLLWLAVGAALAVWRFGRRLYL
jgi:lipooligosaccharide transport system permease protein